MSHCFYCGKVLSRIGKPNQHPTQDHVIPICRGGKNNKANKVLACPICNGDKAGLTLEEYRLVIAFRKKLISPCKKFLFPGEK